MRIEEEAGPRSKSTTASAMVDDSEEAAARAGSSSSAMGAYVEAMRSEDGHHINAKGQAKFNKTQGKRARGDVDDQDDGADVPVTQGLKELEVAPSGKRKKAKRETEKIGGEFKAKVGSERATEPNGHFEWKLTVACPARVLDSALVETSRRMA